MISETSSTKLDKKKKKIGYFVFFWLSSHGTIHIKIKNIENDVQTRMVLKYGSAVINFAGYQLFYLIILSNDIHKNIYMKNYNIHLKSEL